MGEGRSVSETPTWSVATVTTVMVVICFVFVTCEWLKKTWLKAVLSSLQKIKEELRSACQVATERAAACCIVGNGGGVDVAESRKALLRNLWTERIHGAKQNRNLWTERIHGAKQNVEYDDSSMMKLVFPLSCCTLPVGNGVGVDVAERRKALLRNMWTERIHGAKQDVELTHLSFLFLGLSPVRRMKRHFNSSNS
ncbi:hypothetical protein MRB53_023353 [Persea americana]|uniref:Uncharacterized protein n=1 Tax=Persea americana TaxID=3435 RepID=A0ACC2L9B3_PERAE|nr:hypothetical protein MRB53_023353 [Persea americana]